jgi:predicted nucleic acid-binding protein
MAPVIVDTNIIFSALINKNSRIAGFLLEPNCALVMPKFGFVELFKYKEKICAASKHKPDEVLEILYDLLRHIDFFDENSISAAALKAAWDLVNDIDEKDMVFVALTLELNGSLWAGDSKLRSGLEGKGFQAFFSGL